MAETILEVQDLRTNFRLRSGLLEAVDGLSFSVEAGKVLCIVGESGSGKSVTALSILRLIDPPGQISGGRILYRGRDLLTLSEKQMAQVRGDRIAMIFQDPMTSLNPVFTIGQQIAQNLMIHQRLDKTEARGRTIELLKLVGIPHGEGRFNDYPHQFSGGMRQRVLIAAAIACQPDLLIADEPTTALDVTIQAQILQLLSDLQQQLGSAMIFITHDLAVVAALADHVLVMYAGRMVEYGDVWTIFNRPQHPYTRALLDSILDLDDERDAPLHSIPGAPLIPVNQPPGCGFRARCAHAVARCAEERPMPRPAAAGHLAACHLVEVGAADAPEGAP